VAIATLNGVISGFRPPVPITKAAFTSTGAGHLHSSLYLAGMPGAAAAPSEGINGAAKTSLSGQISFPVAVGGQNVYLAGLEAASSNIGGLLLCDLLWQNSGLVVTTTGAQAITFPGLPARDLNGTTSGAGCLAALEVVTATGNAAPVTNCTLSYTDSVGNTGNTASLASLPNANTAGWTGLFDLAAGDLGVQAIASITLGTSLVSGSISLKVIRPIAFLEMPTDNRTIMKDVVQLGMPRMYDNSVPYFLMLCAGASVGRLTGKVTYTQG